MAEFTLFYSGPFSQWHKCSFKIGDAEYNCAEQAMMWHKAMLFGDTVTAGYIMAAGLPREQKALGRQVKPFVEDIWNVVARPLVYRINCAKFTQNDDLLDALFDTAETILVEASPSDRIWGIGLAEDDPRAQDRAQWLGTNWLGEVLTELRDDLLRVFGD